MSFICCLNTYCLCQSLYAILHVMVWCGVVVLYGVTVWFVCLAICVVSVIHYCLVKMSACDQLTEVTCQGHYEASKHTL